MTAPSSTPGLDALRDRARSAATQAQAPFSDHPVGAAFLLSDGAWVPGVRVESASYPLTISALLGGWVTAVTAGRRDVRAVAQSQPFHPGEAAWLADMIGVPMTAETPDAVAFGSDPLPDVGARLDLPETNLPVTDTDGIGLARRAAERAFVPESGFRVGCVLMTEAGRVVPGCNVEYADWTRGLCAERAALAAAAAYDVGPLHRIFLSCPADPSGTPCGACRQLLAEYARGVPIVMDRGEAPPETTTASALLPQFFTGASLRM